MTFWHRLLRYALERVRRFALLGHCSDSSFTPTRLRSFCFRRLSTVFGAFGDHLARFRIVSLPSPALVNETCKVCDSVSRPFDNARVLGRHDVRYYRCDTCGFVQTEHPYWLDEAYGTALIAADVGVAQRNIELAAVTQAVVQQFFRADGRFLDYGGGYGLFVRLMRDRGFDFRWHDRYAQNLLSRGFEAEADADGFELVTAFEVLEHLVDPVPEVAGMLRRGRLAAVHDESPPTVEPEA